MQVQQQILNPVTPMAYLTPDLAYQTTISTYIFVGCSGAFIWDVLNSLRDDFALLSKYRIRIPTGAYFLSRLGSLGYILGSTIFQTAPTGNCHYFEKGLAWLYTLAVVSTSLLFLFRIIAVFDQNIYVVTFFSVMWLAVLGGCLTTTQGITGGSIGPTDYCIIVGIEPYIAAAGILPLVNDTVVLVAISWRLMRNTHVEVGFKSGLRTMVLGDYLPAFTRALLKDGQMYYLATVTTNILPVVMLYIGTVPEVYRTMFTAPNIVLMNIMACRVFKNTKFNILPAYDSSTSLPSPKAHRRRNDIVINPCSLPRTAHTPRDALEFRKIDFGIGPDENTATSAVPEFLHDCSNLDKMERGLQTD